MVLEPFQVIDAEAGHTLAKILRSRLHATQPSWTEVRRIIETRHVRVGGTCCTDSARRMTVGEVVELLTKPEHRKQASQPHGLNIRHLDDDLVVVEKPSGLNTVRHPRELEWSQKRRELVPTLQDVAQSAIALHLNRPVNKLPALRIVHRLDRETSGLLVFARNTLAERHLGQQFKAHTVIRRYLALIPGFLKPQTIRSLLVRDRGDGRRGSSANGQQGKEAITHIEVVERLNRFTLLSCRLETGRTHQIRIHLSEAGHPVCGDRVYCIDSSGTQFPDESRSLRLFLHAVELGLNHPTTHQELHWSMALPNDLETVLSRCRYTG
jgi:23S rRNA pseudouridine1911/1915/1917 synthase